MQVNGDFQNYDKETISTLPLMAYEGKIRVITTEPRLEEALDHLRGQEVVGFDTESRPSFKKGENYPVSLMQLATDEVVYLIRLLQTGMTDTLKNFLYADAPLKVGVGLHDDWKAIFPGAHPSDSSFLDLSQETKGLGLKKTGLRGLSANILNVRVSKRQQTSNWERKELTEAQLRYAATDAWICLKIMERLQAEGHL